MNLSLTAVSENRRFTKALVRHSEALEELRRSLSRAGRALSGIKTLQIVFHDRSPEADPLVGALEPLTQVMVGIPEPLDPYWDNAALFVEVIRFSVIRGISALPLPTAERDLMLT